MTAVDFFVSFVLFVDDSFFMPNISYQNRLTLSPAINYRNTALCLFLLASTVV
jgi:hypothetical protein